MKIVRLIALVAVGFLAVTAIWGAALLMNEPTGSPMQIPVSVLEHSPFHSFLIPGIILLVSSGFLGTAVFLLALIRARGYGWWIAFQGCVLFGWITIEVILLRTVVWLHYVYWGIALLLMACGWALRHQPSPRQLPICTRWHRGIKQRAMRPTSALQHTCAIRASFTRRLPGPSTTPPHP